MLQTYRKLFDLLDGRERYRFVLLMGVMAVVTFAEMLGISTLLVLLNVLSDPDAMLEYGVLNWMYAASGFSTIYPFQVLLAFLVFVVMALGLVIKAFGSYAMIRFSNMRGFSLSSRLLSAYLRQPYTWFLQRNSADISKNVLGEIAQIVGRILLPALTLLSSLMLTIAIIIFLLIVDPIIACTAAVLIAGGYVGIYLALRPKLTRLGMIAVAANKSRFQVVQEATGGFKEVKLLGLENAYVRRFQTPAYAAARAASTTQLMTALPRFALEGVTFAVLLGIILSLLVRNEGDLGAAVPTLGIFAFAVMRLLPTIQNAYAAFSNLRAARPVLDAVHKDYLEALASHVAPSDRAAPDKLPLTRALQLRNIEFSYPNVDVPSVQGITLSIKAHQKIGIVGGTGAGKTTFIDIILGLLPPSKGDMIVDGVEVTDQNLSAWRRSIGYVPQTIYLTDNTIAENIAFGLSLDELDLDAVRRAARIAALDSFIETELPEGYMTTVGERGVRLSGGQRQRIGIARALYHDPELLILDEATSALDNLTERAIMDAVRNIGDEKTFIMIAHRLSTVKSCDQIILMEKGQVEAVGRYEDLVEQNETFRKMAQS